MRHVPLLTLFFTLFCALQSSAFAAAPSTPNLAFIDLPPANKTSDKPAHKPAEKHKMGTWESKSEEGSKVKVKMHHSGVTVTVNKDKDHVPKSIGMTFYDENGKKTNVQLQAVDP